MPKSHVLVCRRGRDVSAVARGRNCGRVSGVCEGAPLRRMTVMRCEEVQDLASAWLDHELSEAAPALSRT